MSAYRDAFPDLRFALSEFQQAGLYPTRECNLNRSEQTEAPLQTDIFKPDRQQGHCTADFSHDMWQQGIVQTAALPSAALIPPTTATQDLSTLNNQLDTCTASAEGIQQLQLQLMQQHQHSQQTEQPTANQDAQKNSNRARQKTFRARQKTKAKAVEAELARVTAQLQEVKLQKQQLQELLQQAQGKQGSSNNPTSSEPGPLTITFKGSTCQMTAAEVRALPEDNFAAFWKNSTHTPSDSASLTHNEQDYKHELRVALHMLKADSADAWHNKLHKLTFEALRFRQHGPGFRCDPTAPGWAVLCRLTQRVTSTASIEDMLAAMQFSSEQTQDIMFLRRVCHAKVQQYDKQRVALAAAMERQATPAADDKDMASADITKQLGQNAMECRGIIHNWAQAMLYGVMHMEQVAQLIIHPDSRKPILFDAIDTLAEQHGYSPVTSQATDVTAHMTNEDWTCFREYVKMVDPDSAVHVGYVPVNRQRSAPGFVSPLLSLSEDDLIASSV